MAEEDLSEVEINLGSNLLVRLVRSRQSVKKKEAPREPNRIFPERDQSETEDDPVSLQKNEVLIKAPMVGTIYLRPSPNDEPFVKIGDPVTTGKVVCMIEAMKMYNCIEVEEKGIIKRCLVQNSVPVEYGQPLFVIEKTHD